MSVRKSRFRKNLGLMGFVRVVRAMKRNQSCLRRCVPPKSRSKSSPTTAPLITAKAYSHHHILTATTLTRAAARLTATSMR